MDYLLPLAGGLISSLIVGNEYKSYSVLNKPSWSPPRWLFGPVWFILYILMGIVLSKIKNKKVRILFYIHLFLNLLWPIVFFKLKKIKESFVNIILVDLTLIMLLFFPKTKLLGVVLIWCLYATALNYYILKNN